MNKWSKRNKLRMKKLTAIVVLSVIVMGSSYAQGNLDNQAAFFQTSNSNVYRLMVDSPEKSKTALNIYNEKGKKVYSDIVSKRNSFTKTYNFNEFPIGVYKLEIEKDGQTLEQTLEHFDDPKNYRPFYADLQQSYDQDKVDLQVVGADSRVVEVVIKDTNGKTIYVDEVSGVMGFKRTYDLTKVGKNVAFEVKVEDKIINMRL